MSFGVLFIEYGVFNTAPEEHEDLSYWVCSKVYIGFKEKHGERLKPNFERCVTVVENGRVVFGTTDSRSNADGLVVSVAAETCFAS